MRRPALLLAFLLVAACDASDPAPPAAAGFEAEVRGAFERTVRGEAAVDSLAGVGVNVELGLDAHGQTITALRLGARDADDTFYLVGTTVGPLAPGTYPIQNAAQSPLELDRTRFVAVYRYADGAEGAEGADGRGSALSQSGTLTVTAVTDDEIAGSFAFDALLFDQDIKDPDAEPDLSVEGAFRADVRPGPTGR